MLALFIACPVAAIFAIVLYKLFTGQIFLQGLLMHCSDGTVVPERIQALLISMVAIGIYAVDAITGAAAAHWQVNSLPDIPSTLVDIAFGSQATYLGGKIIRNKMGE